MNTIIQFKLAYQGDHPDEKSLSSSPLAQLICKCMDSAPDVFGDINFVDVYLSEDGTLGELHFGPDCLNKWTNAKVVPVDLEMFKEDPLSEILQQTVIQYFEKYITEQRKNK